MAIRKPIFVEPAVLTGIASGNETAGHPASHLGRASDIGMTWRSAGNANLWARGQFVGTQAVDFVSLVSANALPGTTIRVRLGTSQAEVDTSAPYDSGAVLFINPGATTWNSRYHSHLEIGSSVGATWWRIDIGGHTGDFEVAIAVFGLKYEPSKFWDVEYERGFRDLGSLDIGRFGVMDETPGAMLRTMDFTLNWQTQAEYETRVLPMVMRNGIRKPVFLCFDPEPTAYRQNRTYMGPMGKPPVARGRRIPNYLGQDFQIVSFI